MSIVLTMTRFLLYFSIICDSFAVCISEGSVGTCFRCGGKYYMSFVRSLVLFLMVKVFFL